jgi:hypothetical protein
MLTPQNGRRRRTGPQYLPPGLLLSAHVETKGLVAKSFQKVFLSAKKYSQRKVNACMPSMYFFVKDASADDL